MNRWDWETLIGKVRAEVGRRYREGLAHQDSPAALWVPLSPRAYREAKWLEEVLLRECAGRSLLDFYNGEEKKTPYGTALVLHETRVFPPFSLSAEVAEAWILSSLRLLYGIGESTEMKLKLAGYTSLRDLLCHPRWAWQAERILQALERRDISALIHHVTRWFPVSRPVSLSLLGLLHQEEFVFLDIETLGLHTEPLILVGLARLRDGEITVTHLVVRAIPEEIPVLSLLGEELAGVKAIVTYNGRAFDVNFIEARLRYYGLPGSVDHPNFDLLPFARRQFREFLPDCRLETVEKILSVQRAIDIPSALVPEFYLDYLRERNVGPLVTIIEHNRQDLLSLALLLRKFWTELVVGGLSGAPS
jgi:uncharacterized protein YprB with RNaseH-like and TPR domain